MPEKFIGDVEIVNSNDKRVFVLSPDWNALVLSNDVGNDTVWIHGDVKNGGSGIELRDKDGKTSFILDAENNALVLCSKNGAHTVWIHGDVNNGGSGIDFRDQDGNHTMTLNGESGDIILPTADCAEDFTVLEIQAAEPGTVMVIDSEGGLRQSTKPYDKKVAGIISGAGNLKPGMVMDRQPSQHDRMPISLMGKAYCKVDAQYSPIEVGDLLTTSLTPGHAMKATDPLKAFGAVIGKALSPLDKGQELIPILIALQ